MTQSIKQLPQCYWFSLGVILCFAILSTMLALYKEYLWMGISICLTGTGIWWQYTLYSIHTKRVLFMIDALENNDNTIHFPEKEAILKSRDINQALNRVARILYNVKVETAQQEKYYELILNCVNTGILVLNDNGAVYQKNNEALHLLGLEVFTHVRQLNKVDTTLMISKTKPNKFPRKCS